MKNATFIKTLYDCAAHCNHCADACLDTDNVAMMKTCIRTDRACAEVCTTTAKLLAASFTDVKELVAYCQGICEQCAAECEQHDHDHCKACAKACKECVSACKSFLA